MALASKNLTGMICQWSLGEQDPSDLILDRISSLPWNVIDIILGKLPMKDAVRTSVLAKDWRYIWLSLSKFVIDSDVIADVQSSPDLRWERVRDITNEFLLNHSSSIKTFYLQTYCSTHYPDLYQWIQHLSQENVEVLFLEELGNRAFMMSSYLYLFDKLQQLFLRGCALQIPCTFKRFNSLSELCFTNVSISDDDLHRLILACPILVKLILLRIYGLERIKIHSPRLSELQIDTQVKDIVIEAAACLVLVYIKNAFEYHEMAQNWRSVIRCLSGLNALRRLVLFGDFIKILAADYALDDFQLRNDTLTNLSLHGIRFDSIEVIRVCLSLLSSCPNIKCFQFSVEAAKGPTLVRAFLKENKGRFSFPELKSIFVMCPSHTGMGCTVNFIEFICAHSPNLRVLSLEIGGVREMNSKRVSQMFARFGKSCPRAVVKYTYNRRSTEHGG